MNESEIGYLGTSQIYCGRPLWLSWKRILLQCGRPGCDPWVGKIPWRREGLPTPVFWPGEFHGLHSLWGHKEADTTEWLLLHFTSDMLRYACLLCGGHKWFFFSFLRIANLITWDCWKLPTLIQLLDHKNPKCKKYKKMLSILCLNYSADMIR